MAELLASFFFLFFNAVTQVLTTARESKERLSCVFFGFFGGHIDAAPSPCPPAAIDRRFYLSICLCLLAPVSGQRARAAL
jgi:hypothetical protein